MADPPGRLPRWSLAAAPAAVAAVAAAALAGCASVTVLSERAPRIGQPQSPPERIFVRDFRLRDGSVAEPEDTLSGLSVPDDEARALSYRVVEQLREHIAPAWRLPGGAMPSESGWLIDGEILRVAPGSAPMRILVGFGAGGSKFETQVRVRRWDGRRLGPPFLAFRTTGGSGASPGLVAALVDYPIVIPLLATGPLATPFTVYTISNKVATETASRGVSDDTERTARMLVGALSDYMVERGFIAPEHAIGVKRDWTAVKELPDDVSEWAADLVESPRQSERPIRPIP